jgi:hypothetical protein
MNPRRTRTTSMVFTTLLLLGIVMSFAHGQSLSSLRIGDAASKLSTLGKPSSADADKDNTVSRWTLANGNELAVTTNKSGQIVHIEADWNPGKRDSESTGCDLPGLRFGETTLAELRKRLGSNGFAFKDRGGQLLAEDGAVMVNSYEANGLVITFYNKVSNTEVATLDAEGHSSIADHARLDAISISDANYAKSKWGERVYDPHYKKVDWK